MATLIGLVLALAALSAVLPSPVAAYVTGAAISIDGGQLKSP